VVFVFLIFLDIYHGVSGGHMCGGEPCEWQMPMLDCMLQELASCSQTLLDRGEGLALQNANMKKYQEAAAGTSETIPWLLSGNDVCCFNLSMGLLAAMSPLEFDWCKVRDNDFASHSIESETNR